MSGSTFLVSINGQIEYIDDILAEAGSCWHCKYELVSGPDWKIIGGVEAGQTQRASVIRNGDKIILNFPLDIVFKSTNVFGWPQIVVSVYNGMHLEGYGCLHLPLKSGKHTQTIYLSKPLSSSFFGYLATFFGYQPELLQPKMLATTAGNNLIKMIGNGQVVISTNVVMQGFHKLGYDVGNK